MATLHVIFFFSAVLNRQFKPKNHLFPQLFSQRLFPKLSGVSLLPTSGLHLTCLHFYSRSCSYAPESRVQPLKQQNKLSTASPQNGRIDKQSMLTLIYSMQRGRTTPCSSYSLCTRLIAVWFVLHYNPQIPFFALVLHKCLYLIGNSAFDFALLDTELFTCHEINLMKFNNKISPTDLTWNAPVLLSNPHSS